MFQLRLEFSHSKDTLADCLRDMTGKPLSLFITDNAASMLSIRTKGTSVSVRMHRIFLNAGEEVIQEIAHFIQCRRGRRPLIRKFINENRSLIRKRANPVRIQNIRGEGSTHNLKNIFDDLNQDYFGGNISALIGWGRENARRVVKKRTLGSYCSDTNTIRINPVLDRKNVPRYFVEYVVYHEMLHGAVRDEKKNGRRSVHPPEFRRQERLFRDYYRATAWEKKHW